MAIKFGTEGWRAIIAEDFTAANVRIVAQAVAEHYLEKAGGKPLTLAVGHDMRFLSDYFAAAVAEVFAGNGISVLLTPRSVPTCAVSRFVLDHKLPAGIMITASHNPGIYNGFKIKESYGGSAGTETVASIEGRLASASVKRTTLDDAKQAGLVKHADMLGGFIRGLKDFIDIKAIKRSRMKVIVESMHGTGGSIIENLIKGGTARVQTLHPEPDPLFGGHAPEPIASHLTELIKKVKRTKADVGIANDGDADRLGIIGPGGRWLNPGQVMCVLLLHLARNRGQSGMVVKTVSNTMMINRLAADLGLRLVETPVGFKYVVKYFQEDDVLIGGEESGGIGVKGYMPERDGILNGLLLLEAIAASRKTLAQAMADLEKKYGRWHYGRRDLHLKMDQVEKLFERLKTSAPSDMAGVRIVNVNRLDGVKLIGADDSWLLFRRSGTEPIVRVYAETPKLANLKKLLDLGVSLVQ